MTSTASVAAVIVNYRRYDLLEDCIGSLIRGTHRPDEIIVVDNASDQGLLKGLAQRFPSVRMISNPQNVGYAAACNQGSRAARGELVLFLNADVTLRHECLERCLKAADADPTIGIVTARLVRPDGALDHACHRGLPTPLASFSYALGLHRLRPSSRRFARYTMSWLDPATDHDVEACSGAFMLVRRRDLEAVGGWDDGFWFYAEDVDLCLRIALTGQRIRFLGTTTANHVKGASSRLHVRGRDLTMDERVHRRRVQEAIVDSHQRFFQKHFVTSTPAVISAAIVVMFAIQRSRIRALARLDTVTPRWLGGTTG